MPIHLFLLSLRALKLSVARGLLLQLEFSMFLSRKLAPFACLALIACAQPSADGATHEAARSPVEPTRSPGDVQAPSSDRDTAGGIERLATIPGQAYGIRKAYDACVESRSRAQDREECSFEEGQFQDGRLNRSYGALRNALKQSDAGAEQALVKAQRAWLAFRDANCDAKSQRFGSDAAPAVLSECYMTSTAMRAQELDDWLVTLATR